jgi:ABC-type transport system involved in multi-copper enzyme maturation permease subunit
MTAAPHSQLHRYQRWSARGGPSALTSGWFNIATTGFRLEHKRPHTQKLLWANIGFVIGPSVILYLLSLLEVMAGTPQARGIYEFLSTFIRVDLSGVARLGEYRELLWRTLFMVMIRLELFWIMIVISRIGPGLIANDLKARALPIYFSRPVTPLTYLLGKWLVIASFIGLATLIPNLATLVMGVLITGGLHTWGQTLGLGLDLLIVGLAVMVFGGALILALSSLTSDSRYVTVGWLAVCLLPTMAQGIVRESVDPSRTTGWLGSISLRDNIVALVDWLFGMGEAWRATPLPPEAFDRALVSPVEPIYPAVVLGAITVVAILICYRRVVRFSRTAANI